MIDGHFQLPDDAPPHTDLLPLQPLPTTVLKNKGILIFSLFFLEKMLLFSPYPIIALFSLFPPPPDYESIYPYPYFNPIQTQIFWTLYHTDVCVLVGAPTGSGKTVAGELAILRELNLQQGVEGENGEGEGKKRKKGGRKIVYIGPMKALVHERVKDWKVCWRDISIFLFSLLIILTVITGEIRTKIGRQCRGVDWRSLSHPRIVAQS